MDYLIHIANILYFFSYSVKDIFALRLLTMLAMCFLIPYFYFQPQPLWAPICWNILFSLINIYRIYLLHQERRPVHFTEKEQSLYNLIFRSISPWKFSKLLNIGEWKVAVKGQCVFPEKVVLDRILLITSGILVVEKNGNCLARLGEGQFVGELSFLTSEPINASVVAEQPTEYFSMQADKLKKLFFRRPSAPRCISNNYQS
ncbi:Crp/Fnr family transcriptional regulator [Candidatus Scalindua japonica]|uniref:Crp/Fnr family transcriptional regulator n=1 Tax=Candidatus Scalindua japonica TaxID=1284222 RepID=UPI000BDE84E0|nr:cyclic nucleotide-binding domain-containing protein [Candidatus Scalindua japonica]